MKKIIFLVLAFLITVKSFSQEFTVPKNYVIETKEDYKALEKDVLAAIDWIYTTPVNEQTKKRIEVNTFLMKWFTGSPYVHLEINTNVVNFLENGDLLIMFMAGWTKYSIESGNYDDKTGGTMAGIEMAIDFYEKNKNYLKKDKNIEKYIKMRENGTLKNYIEKNS